METENPSSTVEVLPAEGTQPLMDLAWQGGQWLKTNAVVFSIGAAVGALLAVYLFCRANPR